MRRRAFLGTLGGAAAWPLVAQAQGERVRRIGVLMNLGSDDAEGQARLAAFLQALQEQGWTGVATRRSTLVGARAIPTDIESMRLN